MNKFTKNALAILVNFAFSTNQLLADLPPETFDSVEWIPYQPVGLGNQPGWQLLSGNATTSAAGEGYNGGKSLKIPVNAQESRISRAVPWDINEGIAFIDLQVTPAADPSGSFATIVANGTQIAFQVPVGSTTGEIWVQHGADGIVDPEVAPKQWIRTPGTFTIAATGTAATSYLRVTLRHDYLTSLWSNKGVNAIAALPSSGGIPPLTIDAEAPHQAVGAVKGSLAVGGDGSANYSVPIDIPKGTAGMEPKLSLGYSSGAGNGMLGVGWNLSGLQRITRGPSSAAKDGSYDAMDFDIAANGSTRDRFFLDGERLVCVAGNYGAPGSEYRTEVDSFARITAIGLDAALTGPAFWKVETKAGLIVTLGETADSKLAVSKGTLSWGVNRVRDTLGNFYSVAYQNDPGNGNFDSVNHRVDRIDYTGAVDGIGNVLKPPYCSVEFTYENRPDVSRSYSTYAGSSVAMRLAKIRVRSGSFVNHSYRLGYEKSYQSGRSLLKTITKHALDSNSIFVPPTTFEYHGIQAVPPGESPIWDNPNNTNLPIYSVGLDNNYVYESSATATLYRIGGTGTIQMANGLNFNGPTQAYSPVGEWKSYDLNIGALGTGGRNCLVLMCVDNESSDGEDSAIFSDVKIYQSGVNPDTVGPILFNADREIPRLTDEAGADLGIVPVDLNSDGLLDFTDWRAVDYKAANGWLDAATQGQIFVNRANGLGSGFARNDTYRPPGFLPLATRHSDTKAHDYNRKNHLVAQPMDIDGDGRLDLLGSVDMEFVSGSKFRNAYQFYTFENGDWTIKYGWSLPFRMDSTASGNPGARRDEHFQWVDLNADGYQDLVVFTSGAGRLLNRTNDTVIAGNSTSVAFLNKGRNGPGWVRDDSFALPVKLMSDGADVGRRLLDLDGDGIPELAQATYEGGNGISRSNHNLLKTGSSKWNPATEIGRTTDPYGLPLALQYSNNNSTATQLMDVNGDGLVDIVSSIYESGALVAYTWLNGGRRDSTPWNLEAAPSADSYRFPYPLHHKTGSAETTKATPYGFEAADVNGDGLIDILYSDIDNAATAGGDNLVFRNTGNGWQAQADWGSPGTGIYSTVDERNSGKRRAKLIDVTGDGFPDLITGLAYGTPKVWRNKCSPEVLKSATDGLGSELTVNYKRLNDPNPSTSGFLKPIYEKGPNVLPVGQAAVVDARLLVESYSETDAKGDKRFWSQRYGDLRYDRHNDASLGFGWIEAMDNRNSQVVRTETHREFPFGGSPILTRTSVYVDAADLKAALVGVTVGNQVLSEESATYAELPSFTGVGGTVRRPVQTASVTTLKDLTGATVSRTTTTQALAAFDSYGFLTASTVTTLDGTSVAAAHTYTHNVTAGRWHLGRLAESTVTKTKPGAVSIAKKSSFTYDPVTGLLASETIEPQHTLTSTKTYTRDTFGNATATTVTGSGITRFGSASYDPTGRFLLAETNQLDHAVYYNYNDQRAYLSSTIGVNGKTTSFSYDSFGTLTRTYHPDGTQTGESTGYASNDSLPASVISLISAPLNYPVRFFRAKQHSGSPVAKVYLDSHGRELVTETTILRDTATRTTSKVYSVTRYDSLGRKVAVSDSFGAADPASSVHFTTISYDLLGRVLKTTHPGGGIDEVLVLQTQTLGGQPVSYSKVKNRNGSILERWEDQHGRLMLSKDPSAQTTSFNHDLEGRLLSVAINNATLLTNVFDALGNKTGVWEKNSGSSSSLFNAFGEVTETTNAKNQKTTFTYDALGRPKTVAKPEGSYETFYDGAPGSALGKPWKTTGPDGYEETIAYDGFGRPVTTRKTQRTPGQHLETFTTATTYDALGRVLTATDAGGLTVVHEYDAANSFPLGLSIGFGSVGYATSLWQAGTFDSKGRAITQTLAQGVATNAAYHPASGQLTLLNASAATTSLQSKTYAWDTLGNLTSRIDALSARTEGFTYDSLNRVTSATVSGTGGPPVANFGYDPNGNLTSKPGATLAYGGIRPHAVTAATVKGASRTYAYDNAGYVTSDGKRTYTWTSFGQLSSLDYLSAPALQNFAGIQIHAPSQVQTNFYFDAGGNRSSQLKQRIAADNSRMLEETLYLGSYERETHSTQAVGTSPVIARTVHRHSIGGFAVYTRTDKHGLASETKLTTLLKDHLGSTDVLYTGTWNGSTFANPVTEKQSFDSWGERRDPATLASYRATDADPFRTSGQDYDRGYTGHEQLDDSGFIHMNGRLYDPELGRMLSPDPYVQVPEYSQNFNRYSYVINNPLNLTDPSGFSWLSDMFHKKLSWLKENWRTVVVIVVAAVLTYFTAGAASAWGAGLYASATGAAVGGTAATIAGGAVAGGYIGAVAGGLGAALNGGNLGDVLRGALIGGVQGAITGGALHYLGEAASAAGTFSAETALHVAGHGVVGGAANVAMGGKFADGFLSGAVSAAAGDAGLLGSEGGGFGGKARRTIMAGVVGGTASALGGGKFANGAYTAAFQHLLNAELSEALKARRLQYAEQLLSVAEHEIGVSENGGSSDIARIKQYHNSTGDARGSGEGTPWCSSFVNWVLETTGNTGTDSAWAQGWKSWGRDAGGPVLGALAVFKNVKGGGHVGFVAGVATDGTLRILGGNQSDRVKYSNFNPNGSTLKIIAFRVPNIPNRALIVAPVVGGQAGNESTR